MPSTSRAANIVLKAPKIASNLRARVLNLALITIRIDQAPFELVLGENELR